MWLAMQLVSSKQFHGIPVQSDTMTNEGSPHHWTNLAGAGINAAAGGGTAAVLYDKTRHYPEKANREYFAPRGLQISIYKHERLAEKLGLDSEAAL